ncbi:MAG: hypothetical protein DRN71_00485 [Candidatus Nanohalarchaeota archaeon]|nr:MAG: hypothetical protein DRN71_00485 [Candidatus Nanohaloarchaeota archaeon]
MKKTTPVIHMNKRNILLSAIYFILIINNAHAWDVSVIFDNAREGPIRPFTPIHGTTGTTYYADFDTTDTFGPDDNTNDGRYVELCSTGCGTECVWANNCRTFLSGTCNAGTCSNNPYDNCVCFDMTTCYRPNGWFVQRTKVTNNKYIYKINGKAHADCMFANHGFVSGTSILNPAGSFQITSIDYCSANNDNKGQPHYCTINMAIGTISWAGGSTCNGCCCCEDSGGLNIKMTVEKIADTNPPTLVSFTDPGNVWTDNCDISTSWSCSDSESGMSTTTPYKLYIYNSGSWHAQGWGTHTTYTHTATEFDNIVFGLECRDNEGNIGGPWYTTQYTKCDTTKPSSTIRINNNAPATKTTDVTITLSYTDIGSGINNCRYRNNDSIWTIAQPCTPSKTWTLETGDGLKTVYYEVKDIAGNTNLSSDTILLDTTPPHIQVNVNPKIVASSQYATFTANCNDAGGSGCSTTNITIPSLNEQCEITGGSGTCQIKMPECVYDTYTYYVNTTDNLGNINDSVLDSFEVKKADGCECILSDECISISCLDYTMCGALVPPEVDFSTNIGLTIALGQTEAIPIILKNPAGFEDTIKLDIYTDPPLMQQTSYFEGEKYSKRTTKIVRLKANTEEYILLHVFGGKTGTYHLMINAQSLSTTLQVYNRTTVKVVLKDNQDIHSNTPELSFISMVIVFIIAYISYNTKHTSIN